MANTIKINISAVLNADGEINKSISIVDNVKLSLSHTQNQISTQIMNCGNLQTRFHTLVSQLAQVSTGLERIKHVSFEAANQYYQTDEKLKRKIK